MSPVAKRAFGLRDLEEFRARMAELVADQEPPTEPGAFVAHTDGACLGNPEGPGGWAAVVDPGTEAGPGIKGVVDLSNLWMLWGHLSSTSNNRAEALGVLAALEWVPPSSRLTVYSDSELTVRIFQGRYKARANPDIWDVIKRTRADKRLEVTVEWLRGHAGHPRNELADRLSKLGATNGRAELLDEIDTATPAARKRTEPPPELVGVVASGEWERTFLRSVADQLRRRRPLSAKQQVIIDRMRARGAPAE